LDLTCCQPANELQWVEWQNRDGGQFPAKRTGWAASATCRTAGCRYKAIKPTLFQEKAMNDFLAFDVETANHNQASICQIGIACFIDGVFREENSWKTYVNPEDDFDFGPFHVGKHKITPAMVAAARTFPQISELLLQKLGTAVVVHHMPFDRNSIRQSFAKHNLALPPIKWLDSACVVRRTWPELSSRGYGLESVTDKLGIVYQPHDAAEDARAAGEVFLHAIRKSGFSVDEWMVRVGQPMKRRSWIGTATKNKRLEGNPDGPLHGETALFTGKFSVVKEDLRQIAADVGCDVGTSVTDDTSLVIVGEQDPRKLKGKATSEKEEETDRRIAKGQNIRKLRETDFRALVNDVLRSDELRPETGAAE
jgi:DNA polymerase III subunit epsilon